LLIVNAQLDIQAQDVVGALLYFYYLTVLL
jgi:hypothetical protein